mmetsp:Transcript_40185/g.110482  ORF Transcript_40185/g.110482 Transcript_40185/m.110482 type:complete len:478 (-) Transcript_40185:106-1539(-)
MPRRKKATPTQAESITDGALPTAPSPPRPSQYVDFLEVRDTEQFGPSAFAAQDIAAGGTVISEVPLLEAPLVSSRVAPHLAELVSESLVDTGRSLLPEKVTTKDVGVLDAFTAAGPAVQQEVAAMQCSVDSSSPMRESAKRAALLLEKLELYEGLDAEIMERVLLVSRVNAYAIGKDKEALFARGRLVAHACRPNCIFVAERDRDESGEIVLHGCFRALRDISKGELLTVSYAIEEHAAVDRSQRRHYLLCQKGFWCQCSSCSEDGQTEDMFDRWPCPSCRPRGLDGNLSEEQLAGCCVVRAAGRSPPWRSECGRSYMDEQVQVMGAEALAQETLRSVSEGSTGDSAASRNALLARVLRRFGEDHWATQLLLRAGAFRAVMVAQALPSTVVRVARCHDFLVSAGWPLGMMPLCGLYRALIVRAQAEVKAKAPVPTDWPRLVADAARCAAIVEGPGGEHTRLGTICANLLVASVAKEA